MSSLTIPAAAPLVTASFGFDSIFEKKVAALVLRDLRFLKETADYLDPTFFTDALDSNLVRIAQGFVKKHNVKPELPTVMTVVRSMKEVDPSEHLLYAKRLVEIKNMDLSERPYIRERVNEFCKRQALLLLAADIPDLIEKDRIDRIESRQKKISTIGDEAQEQRYDFYKEAASRLEFREKVASGEIVRGVSTGFPDLDKHLYHGGFERGGLTSFMAPAKRAKTALMLQSALCGTNISGTTALFVSLEVGRDIVVDRLDAALTTTSMSDLITEREAVKVAADGITSSPGRGSLFIECFPSNTLTMGKLEAIIDGYMSDGIALDAVFVDYIGIMRMPDPKDRYTSLGNTAKDLRRLAGEFDVAMVTAAQTNRGGLNMEVAGMESIGESFAIVQDVDLLISINANDAELASGVRRIHWAASRNEAERTITVRGDLDVMQVIQTVVGTSI